MTRAGRFVRRNVVDEPVAIAVGVLAGVLAATAGAEPTGQTVVDVVVVAAAVFAVVWAAASAPWWALAGAAGVAAVVAFDPVVALLAACAFAGGLLIGVRRRDDAALRALVAAVTMNALVRSQLDVVLGLSAVVGVSVGLVLFVLGVRRRPSAVRSVGTTGAVVVGACLALAIGAAALSALSVRSDLTRANRAARQAVEVLNTGEYETAASGFADAAESFRSADRRLGGPLGRLGRLVPGVAQNVTAGVELSEAAGAAFETVADALGEVDPDALRVVDGAIDVAAIQGVRAPLVDVQASLTDLRQVTDEVRSPWLLGRFQDELDDLDEEFDQNEPRLQNAIDAVTLAPQLLGADAPRRYLVLFTSPVEARGVAGFVGNYAVVEIDDGDIDVADFGRRSELEETAAETGASCADCPAEMLARYGRFGIDAGDGTFGRRGWSAITLPAHFPHVGEAAQIMFPQSGGSPIDGVIAMDPYIVQALMRYTGPIDLVEAGVTVTPDDAARFLLEGQYALISESSNDERIEAIDTLGQQVIEELLDGALPVPSDLARDIGPLVAERRLLVWTEDATEQRLLDRIGLLGALPALGDDGGFGVMVSNAGHNKIDAFLDRTVDTFVETDGDGSRVLVADVTLTNDAPRSGLPDYVIGNEYGFPTGTSWMWINFFGPDTLIGATRNGEPVELSRSTGAEAGWWSFESYEALAAGASVDYRLRFALEPVAGTGGDVVRWTQPLARRAP